MKAKKTDRQYIVSLWVLFGVAFAMLFDLSIIMPTGALYFTRLGGGDISDPRPHPSDDGNFYFGLAMVLFSTFQTIGNFGVGFVSKALGMRLTLFILLTLATIGNMMYGIGWTVWFALVGRSVAGLGSCCLGLVLAYVSLVVTPDERLTYMGYFRVISNLGLIVAPGTAVILYFFDFPLWGDYRVDQYNSPGYATGVICLIFLIASIIWVKNPSKADLERMEKAKKDANIHISRGVLVVFVSALLNGITGTTFEYMLAPITQSRKFGWVPVETGFLIVAISICSIVAVIVISYLQKLEWLDKIGERFWQLEGYLLMIFGVWMCYFGTQEATHIAFWLRPTFLTIGTVIAMDAWMILTVTLNPMYSKIIPPASRIVMMPWQPAFSSFGRIFGPLIAAFIMQLDYYPIMLFGYVGVLCAIAAVLQVVYWQDLSSDTWMQFVSEDEVRQMVYGDEDSTELKHASNPDFSENLYTAPE